MGQETIWTLEIDMTQPTDSLAVFRDAMQAAQEAMTAFASSATDLSGLDDALSSVAGVSADTTAQIEGLNETIAQLSGTIEEDNSIISGLNETVANLEAQLGALKGEFDGASEGAGGLAAMLGGVRDVVGSVGEALQAARGPLLMISMAGVMAGKSFFDMGMQAEDSLNQVQSLAGVAPAAMAQYTAQLEAQATQFGETLDQEGQGLYYVTSAGFKNADAMQVLAQSVEDAKAGHIDLGVAANALTTALNAYGASADQANQYNDIMVTAVTQGKQTFQDFASSIAKAAVEGNAAHISFAQVAAGEATLTQQGFSARLASMDLATMMKALDSDIDKTANTAANLGLNFDETSYKSMDLFHQMQYLQQITQGNQTEIGKLVGGSAGLQAFNALMTQNADGSYKFAASLDAMQHSAGATTQAFQTSQETISSHMQKIGAAFSVISFKALEAIAPEINSVADAVSHAADFMTSHMNIMMPVLAGLATMFGVIIVGAIAGFIASLSPVVAIIAGIAVAIGAVVGVVTLLTSHWQQVTQAFQQNAILHEILIIFQQIGAFLVASFMPIWQQLVTLWRTQLLPAFMQAWQAIQPLMPALQVLGAIIGGVVVFAILSLIATIGGLLRGFAAMLPGLIQVASGVIQIFSGMVQVVMGIVNFFTDLFTGRFNKLGADLGQIWHGITEMIDGALHVVEGLILAAIGFITGSISGFVSTFLGSIVNLGNALGVKIPALISQIGAWFGQLPGMALHWAQDMIDQFVAGIMSGVGKVGDAVQGIANKVKSFLGFSIPEAGPLTDADQWMPDFMQLLEKGIQDNAGRVKNASLNVATSLSLSPTTLTTPSLSSPTTSIGGSDQATQYLAQIVSLLAQMVQRGQGNVSLNPSFPQGTVSNQQLNQAMQYLSGLSYESVARGGV